MKTSIIRPLAISLLSVAIAASALAGPPSKGIRKDPTGEEARGRDPLCQICKELSEKPGRAATTINGRTYDPKLPCHRVYKHVRNPSGKGMYSTMECVCS